MNDARLYYSAPPQECFEDMKNCAIQIWKGYDNEYGYADEKINQIKDIGNVKDNFMYILAMFDDINQRKMGDILLEETKSEARARMIDGGMPGYMLPF
jgi:plastocyanin domain-containing protein